RQIFPCSWIIARRSGGPLSRESDDHEAPVDGREDYARRSILASRICPNGTETGAEATPANLVWRTCGSRLAPSNRVGRRLHWRRLHPYRRFSGRHQATPFQLSQSPSASTWPWVTTCPAFVSGL